MGQHLLDPLSDYGMIVNHQNPYLFHDAVSSMAAIWKEYGMKEPTLWLPSAGIPPQISNASGCG